MEHANPARVRLQKTMMKMNDEISNELKVLEGILGQILQLKQALMARAQNCKQQSSAPATSTPNRIPDIVCENQRVGPLFPNASKEGDEENQKHAYSRGKSTSVNNIPVGPTPEKDEPARTLRRNTDPGASRSGTRNISVKPKITLRRTSDGFRHVQPDLSSAEASSPGLSPSHSADSGRLSTIPSSNERSEVFVAKAANLVVPLIKLEAPSGSQPTMYDSLLRAPPELLVLHTTEMKRSAPDLDGGKSCPLGVDNDEPRTEALRKSLWRENFQHTFQCDADASPAFFSAHSLLSHSSSPYYNPDWEFGSVHYDVFTPNLPAARPFSPSPPLVLRTPCGASRLPVQRYPLDPLDTRTISTHSSNRSRFGFLPHSPSYQSSSQSGFSLRYSQSMSIQQQMSYRSLPGHSLNYPVSIGTDNKQRSPDVSVSRSLNPTKVKRSASTASKTNRFCIGQGVTILWLNSNARSLWDLLILPISTTAAALDTPSLRLGYVSVYLTVPFTLDLFVKLFTPQKKVNGTFMSLAERMRSNITKLDFLLSIILAIPFDTITRAALKSTPSALKNTDALHFIRLIGLLQLSNMMQSNETFLSISLAIRRKGSSGVHFVDFMKSVSHMLVFLHLNACLILALGKFRDYVDKAWETVHHHYHVKLYANDGPAYSWAIFASTANTFDLTHEFGYISVYDQWFQIVLVLIGRVIFATLIESISEIARGKRSEILYKERMDQLQEYAKFTNLPPDLAERLQEYFAFKYSGMIFEGDFIVDDLNPELHMAVLTSPKRNLITKVPFLIRNTKDYRDEVFAGRIAEMMRPEIYLAGDIINTENRLHFISKGTVLVCEEDGEGYFDKLEEGRVFG
ncbi:anaphase-promoting complex subunit Hcn1, partial [Quaeritorhiza haematococci]